MKHLIGEIIEYRNGSDTTLCEILAVKAGPMMLNTNSQIGSPKFTATYKAKLRPTDGGKEFWTGAIAT